MVNQFLSFRWVALAVIGLALIGTGCGSTAQLSSGTQRSSNTQRSWHDKFNWKAEEYFEDKQVITLCKAIEANDLDKMKHLIDAGADVNAKGKGNMTPLLWAFPDNKIERFKLLLEKGADPNVFVESDFNTKNLGIRPGDSVTQMAAKSAFPEHFSAVMEHRGDPNLMNPKTGDTVLFEVIRNGKRERVELLVEKGADVNQKNRSGVPPIVEAISWFAQFDLALYLLDCGADPRAYIEDQNSKLVHKMLSQKNGLHRLSTQQQADYYTLEKRLKEMGESFEEAEADRARWASWAAKPRSEMKRLREAEIAARREKQQSEEKEEQR